jgi:hypothetical protein
MLAMLNNSTGFSVCNFPIEGLRAALLIIDIQEC